MRTSLLRRRAAGWTMLEATVVLAFSSLLMAWSLPSLDRMRQRHLQLQASQALIHDLRWARSEAIQRGLPVEVSLHQTANGQCLLIHVAALGPCTCQDEQRPACSTEDTWLAQRWWPRTGPWDVQSTSSVVRFAAHHGFATPTASFTLRHRPSGETLQQVLALNGRARQCQTQAWWPHVPTC